MCLTENSSGYTLVSFLTSYIIWFFFKLVQEMVFHAFQFKFNEYYSRVYGKYTFVYNRNQNIF